ncbi:MAG TPA: hypothetical protein PK297_11065 [Spirochaetota bacterium]|nr:hypothetical protein [Spirochaetota bacterium]
MRGLLLSARGLVRTANEDGVCIIGTTPGDRLCQDTPATMAGSCMTPGITVHTIAGCEFESIILDLAPPLACLISDGMGGMGAGDRATAAALASFARDFPALVVAGGLPASDQIDALFYRAHDLILRDSDHPGMGAAIAGVCVDQGGRYLVFHAGDARIGRLRSGLLELLTRDHAGDALGSLSNCLGGGLPRELVFCETRTPGGNTLAAGQRLVAMTDGVYGPLDEDRLDQLAALPLEAIPEQARRLLEGEGAPDNYSLLILEG